LVADFAEQAPIAVTAIRPFVRRSNASEGEKRKTRPSRVALPLRTILFGGERVAR
jgi:hypothetical protein